MLGDVTVLEYCHSIAGAYCAKQLAELGATVIKIEDPVVGDIARYSGPFPDDIPHLEKSGLFLYVNINKRGITLNPLTTAGRQIFADLVAIADIVIEDNLPGMLKKEKLEFNNLEKINPDIIVTSITPFGQSGCYSHFKAYSLNIYQSGGLGYITPPGTVYLERPPLKQGKYVTDYHAGTGAALITLAALFEKQYTGQGCYIDFSMQEWELNLYKMYWARFSQEKQVINRRNAVNPAHNAISCKDGYVTIVFQTDYQWICLVELIGRPELLTDIRFETPYQRLEHGNELYILLCKWAQDYTMEELYHRGQQKGLPIGMVCKAGDIHSSQQLKERDFFIDIEHPVAGNYRYPGIPYELREMKQKHFHPAPTLGQHNMDIYCNLLGYTKEALNEFRESHVI